MVTITYGTAYCTLSSESESEERLVCHGLDMELAIRVPGYFFTPAYQRGVWDGFEHFFSRTKKQFATGLLPRVLKVLRMMDAEVSVQGFPESWDGWEDVKEIVLTGPLGTTFALRDYQVACVQQILKFHRGIVKIATNGGKTEVWAGLMKVLGSPPSIFMVPRKEIFTQTVQRFEERLGVRIGKVGEGQWDINEHGITVVMYHTFHKGLKDKKGRDKTIKKWRESCVAVCADECHMLSADGYRESFDSCGGDFRVGMSGTPFNKDKPVQRARLVGATGAVLADVSNEQLIDMGVSERPNILQVNVRVLPDERDMLKNMDYRDSVMFHTNRNRVISIFVKAFLRHKMQTMVMVSRTKHGLQIMEWTDNAVLVTSQTKNRAKARTRLERGDVFACVCTAVFDTGLSVDHIQGMINAAEGESEQTLLQRVGRTLRKKYNKNLWIIDFVDDHNTIARRHASHRMEVYRSQKAFNIVNNWRLAPLDESDKLELLGLLK